MPIRTQLLKEWVGSDPEKHIGSTPLAVNTVRLATVGSRAFPVAAAHTWNFSGPRSDLDYLGHYKQEAQLSPRDRAMRRVN